MTTRLWLLAALLVTSAHADLGPCLVEFATLAADEEDAPDLVSHTYTALLDRFGLELTPETLLKIKASGNPFLVPDQKGTDLNLLRKNLKGFEELVETKRWRVPEVTARLLTDLDVRVAKIAEVEDKIARGLRLNGDFDFKVRKDSYVAQSPDGRYFLSAPWNKSDGAPWIEVFDASSGKVTTVPRGEGELKALHFSNDGREIRFYWEPGGFGSAPFEHGIVRWDKRKMIPTPVTKEAKPVTEHSASPDPEVYLAGMASIQPHYLVNVREGKVVPIDVSDLLDITKIPGAYEGSLLLRGWGYIPGSDRIWFRVRNGLQDSYTFVAKISPEGVITRESTIATFPLSHRDDKLDPHQVAYSHDGKKVYFHGSRGHDYLGVSSGPGTPIKVLKSSDMGNRHEIGSVLAHPTEPVMLVSMHDTKAKPSKVWVEIIDVNTNAKKADVPLPDGTGRVEVSPDGAHVYAFGRDGTGKAISLARHLR